MEVVIYLGILGFACLGIIVLLNIIIELFIALMLLKYDHPFIAFTIWIGVFIGMCVLVYIN